MGYRKNKGRMLAGILVVGMLLSSQPSIAYAVERENDAVAVTEQEMVTEDNGTEIGVGTQEQEESEIEATEPEEDGGEKETGETLPEDDENVSGAEEGSVEENVADDTIEENEEIEEDGSQKEAVTGDVLLEQAEAVITEVTVDEGGVTSGSCGENVTWEFEDGVLTISGSGAMEEYDPTSEKQVPWYEYRETIKGVAIEKGVTSIGSNSFRECSNLTSIDFSSGVTSIGLYAFFGCSSLTSIEIPSEVTFIGGNAFKGCSSLTGVKIPSGVTSIGWYVFSECSNLTSIEIPLGVTAIESGAFSGCSGLTSIEIPSKVTSIEHYVFQGCSSLASIEIPSEVTVIGYGAFRDCKSLTSIEIPSGVTSIERGAFSGCSNLESIKIPSGVTSIKDDIFYGCSSLTSVEIESGVTLIGDYAFWGCSNLTSIKIPSSVTSIGTRAFEKCDYMTDVYYGGSESDWLAVEIGSNNDPLMNATIHYNSSGLDGEDPAPVDPPKPPLNDPTLDVKSRSFEFTDPQTVQLVWGWNYILNRSSTEYIHDVSTVALALSAAAERSRDAVESMLAGEHFGADFITSKNYNTDSIEEINNPACTFAHKAVNNGGKTEHIIIIVGRGTSTDADLITDAISLGDHFSEPASSVWRSFLGWLETNGLTGKVNSSNTKFFVTGHSLGGAVANRIAYRLTQDYGRGSVYAYTFGTPPTEGHTSTYVPNIFNVLYYWDPVPYMGIFTDGRYGMECWFNDGDRGRFLSKHYVQSYMKRLLNGADQHFRGARKGGGAWCPVDLKIYNSFGNLVGSVTDNVVDEGNVTDSVLIVLSGENRDQKNFYFFDDDTYTIELLGKDNGTLTYTIRDTSADKLSITERVYSNVSLTPGKRMTSLVSAWDKTDSDVSVDDKIDTLQVQLLVLDENDNIVREVLPDGAGTEIPYTGSNEVRPEDIPADGKIPDGLWIAGVEESYIYTGAAIKPEIRVYDGKKKLQSGKDYTVSYKNNTKVNDAAVIATAPTIAVKGKGNYAGTETATFKITPVSLNGDNVTVEDMTAAYNKKVQKKVPVVSYNGRKLAKNRDFTVSYPDGGAGAYKEAGTYEILLVAKEGGNFTGTRTVTYTITDSTLLGRVSVKKIPNQMYTGEPIEPELTVTYKNTPLVKGTDYTVRYTDHTEIGTAKAVLTGIGKYAGTKKVTFRITGISLKGAAVSGIENKVYNGNDQEHSLTVAQNGRTLTAGTDYDVVYADNRDVGKASVTIKGKGAYTGSIKKTFRIEKFDIAANTDDRFVVEVKQENVPYAKGGAKPKVVVNFRTENGGWRTLKAGTDYTLSYRNHKAVNDGSRADRQPAVIVKGKGNFGGVYGEDLHYKIETQDLGRLTLTAQDRTYRNKRNSFATKLAVTDLNGVRLQSGTDYQKVFGYFYEEETAVNTADGGTIAQTAGDAVDKGDIIPAGTVLKVRVTAKEGGNYTGTLEGKYRIVQADIVSASVSVKKQIYTGQPVTLEKSQITVKVKGKELDESQYEIVPGSYKNNVHKGTASVTVRGVNNYGGTKTVRFTIRAKGFFWWWR